MNFDFLPWPIQVALLLLGVGVCIHDLVMKKNTDTKGKIIMYFIMIMAGITFVVLTILRYNTELYVLYPDVFVITTLIVFCAIYFQLSFLVFTLKGDRQKVRKGRISYGIMTLGVIGLIMMYFTL